MLNNCIRESPLLKWNRASVTRHLRYIFKLENSIVEKYDGNENAKSILMVNRLPCNGQNKCAHLLCKFVLKFTVFDYKYQILTV